MDYLILSVDEQLRICQKSNVKLVLKNSSLIFERINRNNIQPDYLSWDRLILKGYINNITL